MSRNQIRYEQLPRITADPLAEAIGKQLDEKELKQRIKGKTNQSPAQSIRKSPTRQ